MFSLKHYARKNIRLVALGAAAASTVCITAAALAGSQDNIYWDPNLNGAGTGSGGSGSFDDTTNNFWNPHEGVDTSIFWMGWRSSLGTNPDGTHNGYWAGDMVHFAGAAGVVTVNTPTNLGGITIDTNGYTINGAALTFNNSVVQVSTSIPVITVTTGNSTISSDIVLHGTNGAYSSVISIATGSTLTTGNILNTAGGYGQIIKTGNGVLNVTGNFNPQSAGGSMGLSINAGTVILSGTSNAIGPGPNANNIIASGATLAGNATIAMSSSIWTIAGNVAPGANTPGSNFGGTGTLAFKGGFQFNAINFTSTAQLDFDLTTPDLNPDHTANTGIHDIFQVTGSNYGSGNSAVSSLTFAAGTAIDIDNGTGTLVPGTYHIIQLVNAANGHPVTLTDSGLTIGIAPAGYTYSLVDLSGNAGIDLIVGVLAGSTWSATTGLGDWSNAANWTGSVPNTAGSTATFGTGTVTTVNVDAPQTVGNIQFTGANNYTIGGATASTITLDNSGSMSVITVMGGTQAITSALVLNNSVEISNDPSAGGSVNISGGITGTGNISLKNKSSINNALTLSGAAINNVGSITNSGTGTGSVLISAAIGSNVTNITQSSGTSNLIVTGNNTTFAGTTTISSGTLSFGTNSLGTTGTITFTGGTLQWAPGNSQDVSSRFAATPSAVNIDTNGNAVTFANPLTSTNTNTLTVSSTAAGGTLVLTGAQTYTGVTTVNSGTLQLAPGASLNNTTVAPVINAAGTLDINGNLTTIGVSNGNGITNNGIVTNTGSHTTLTLKYSAGGTGAYTGNMDLVLQGVSGGTAGGAVFNVGVANNAGSVTVGPTTSGFYGQVNIATVGTNVTGVSSNGRLGMTIGTLHTNSAGTTLTANLFTDGSYAPITVTNAVVGTGNLILAGISPIGLPGGVNMTGTVINNSTYVNGINLVSVGSNVTGLTQNSNTGGLRVGTSLVVNSGGTTLTAVGSAGFNTGGTISGTGNLLVVNNNTGVNIVVGSLINNVGQIIVSGTSGGYVTLGGATGAGIGSNVTGITQNSNTVNLTVSAYRGSTFTVNLAGTTITENENAPAAGIDIDPAVVGTGNLNFVENGAATINASALVNNVGVVNVSGTGGGYVQLFGGVGSNITAINQNSATSHLQTSAVTVNSGGTTIADNAAGGIDLAGTGVGGTGNVTFKNNTALNNVFIIAAINNAGTFTNAGTGGGYLPLNPGIIGSNVTQVIQNSATSALVLNGAQTYTAPTTVQLGTLIVNGSLASNVTVQSGGIASGNGSMPTLAVQSGGHVAPSGMGTLTTGTLNLASGAKLDYNFGTPGNNSSITVTGGASSLTLSSGVLLNALGSAATVGVGDYKLVGYGDTNAIAGWTDTTGSITGGVVSNSSPGTFLLGTGWSSAANLNYTITDDAANSGIFIDFTAGVAGGVPPGSGVWKNGTGDGKWTTNTSANNNWSGGIPNGIDQVATFDDTVINGPGTVDLNGDKTVGGLLLNTASAGYTLGLPGTTNTLTLQTSTGNASIGVGGAASHTINALVNLASNTNVSFIAGASLNLVGAVSGTGSLNLSGTGTLKLSAAAGNTYTGTNVSGGTLLVSNTSGSATGASNVVVTGGTLGGHGIISGTVNASSGTQTLFPSATLSSTSTGTLTVGGLTTGSGTTLQFNLVTPGNALNSTVSNSDAIMVTGANGLTLNGGTVNLTNHSTGAASLGFYKVIAYSGAIGGTGLSSLTLPATVANVEYTFDTTHDAGFVDIHRGFAGDVDDSGFVDINDLAILAAHWQQTGGWAQGNFLNDPLVDINDLAILAANWQTGITSFGEAADSLSGTSESFQQAVAGIVFGGVSSVPEPTSLALLGMGAVGLLVRRRRR